MASTTQVGLLDLNIGLLGHINNGPVVAVNNGPEMVEAIDVGLGFLAQQEVNDGL